MEATKKYKVIVTGANGQVGQSFRKINQSWLDYEFQFFDRRSLDITKEIQLRAIFKDLQPDVFINCAAYTAVDLAEDNQAISYEVNAQAPGHIARLCEENNTVLIHYSSDYVYDSITDKPLTESEKTTPRGVYAKSKLEGEKHILNSNALAIILRTSWVYSEFGNNFVKTMLRLGSERSELRVVNDQIGAPTYASDIVSDSMKIVDQIMNKKVELADHIVLNYAGAGQISWCDFADYIFECAEIDINLEGIPSSEYPTKAPRPSWSVMDMMKIKSEFGIAPKYWKESVKECIEVLNKKSS